MSTTIDRGTVCPYKHPSSILKSISSFPIQRCINNYSAMEWPKRIKEAYSAADQYQTCTIWGLDVQIFKRTIMKVCTVDSSVGSSCENKSLQSEEYYGLFIMGFQWLLIRTDHRKSINNLGGYWNGQLVNFSCVWLYSLHCFSLSKPHPLLNQIVCGWRSQAEENDTCLCAFACVRKYVQISIFVCISMRVNICIDGNLCLNMPVC